MQRDKGSSWHQNLQNLHAYAICTQPSNTIRQKPKTAKKEKLNHEIVSTPSSHLGHSPRG